MSDTSLSALLPPLHFLLLGYGHVAQALLPLLASRSEWIGNELGYRPVISGIGTRSEGFFVHEQGMDANRLTREELPTFRNEAIRVETANAFINAAYRIDHA